MMAMTLMTTSTKKPPMFLLIMIIMITIMMASEIMSKISGHWSAMLLVMVYVSGVMILFMYTTSLSPYEKTKNKTSMWVTTVIMVMLASTETDQTGSTKLNIFQNSMNSASTNIMVIILLSAMATVVPKMMINTNKGMKSSK